MLNCKSWLCMSKTTNDRLAPRNLMTSCIHYDYYSHPGHCKKGKTVKICTRKFLGVNMLDEFNFHQRTAGGSWLREIEALYWRLCLRSKEEFRRNSGVEKGVLETISVRSCTDLDTYARWNFKYLLGSPCVSSIQYSALILFWVINYICPDRRDWYYPSSLL